MPRVGASPIQLFEVDDIVVGERPDVVGHPSGLVSHKEFTILNPPVSASTISKRLSRLQAAGVVETVLSPDQSPGEPRKYYYLTREAGAIFDRNGLFPEASLQEMFDRLNHSEEFRELLEKTRPDIETDTTDFE